MNHKPVMSEGMRHRLRGAYAQSGFTYVDLAKKVGCERKAIMHLISGDSKAMNFTYFARICKELKVSADYIFYGEQK